MSRKFPQRLKQTSTRLILDLRLDPTPKTDKLITVGTTVPVVRWIRSQFGAEKFLSGDGGHRHYRGSRLNILIVA